jgi:CrcB protein
MGLLAGWLARLGEDGEPLRLLLGVGVLGGFTTFSAFSLEVFAMISRADLALAGAYAVSSVAGSVLAVLAGVWLMRSVG